MTPVEAYDQEYYETLTKQLKREVPKFEKDNTIMPDWYIEKLQLIAHQCAIVIAARAMQQYMESKGWRKTVNLGAFEKRYNHTAILEVTKEGLILSVRQEDHKWIFKNGKRVWSAMAFYHRIKLSKY